MRLSAMGDVAMAAPVVEALRAAYPEMRITILTRPFFRPFFRDIKEIEFLDFDPKKHKGLGGLYHLSRDIRELGVDAVADLHDVLRTKVIRYLLWMRGYPVAYIDKGRYEKELLTRRTRKRLEPLTPVVERYRQTVSRLGIRFSVPTDGELERKVRDVPDEVTAAAGAKDGIWIGVAPFAQHKGKIYPIPLMDELIGMLAARYGRVFVFGGGAYEKSFADGMERRHKGAVSMIGRVGLSQEMDVISNLDVMVSMDSSSMHMASLVGTPVVSVWGATHPYAGFYGFRQDPDNAVQLDMTCRPCSVYGKKKCIFGDYRCLRNIPPETIAAAVARVVETEKPVAADQKAAPETKGKTEKKTGPAKKPASAKAAGTKKTAATAKTAGATKKHATAKKTAPAKKAAPARKPASRKNTAE